MSSKYGNACNTSTWEVQGGGIGVSGWLCWATRDPDSEKTKLERRNKWTRTKQISGCRECIFCFGEFFCFRDEPLKWLSNTRWSALKSYTNKQQKWTQHIVFMYFCISFCKGDWYSKKNHLLREKGAKRIGCNYI